MAQTVRETIGVFVPPTWQPGPCPDLTSEPFASVDAPWRTRIDQKAIDPVRTAALNDVRFNVDVAHNLPGAPYQGVVFGMPYQVLDQRTKETISFQELGLPAKVVGYNHDRPHSAIGNRPPISRAPEPGPRLTHEPIELPPDHPGQLSLDLDP